MDPARRTFRVEILTEDLGYVPVARSGFALGIQAPVVVVTCDGDARSHVVVRAAEPPWTLPDDALVRTLFPGYFVACTRADAEGAITLSCSTDDFYMMAGAACAAATLKRAWGWDESPSILVRFVSSPPLVLELNPEVLDGTWTVTGLTITKACSVPG